jgi:large subunit ribosomal protein L4e
MKLKIMNPDNTETGTINSPLQFQEPVRPDLIKKAVLALQAHHRQPYGAFPLAGKRPAATLSKRRRDYRGSYGIGISRTPRKILSRRGTRMNWVGAFAPNTVKGRRAHPPKADKIWTQKLNKKENRKAIRSALSATLNKEQVTLRGHRIPPAFPFIIDNSFETLTKTKAAITALRTLGFTEELSRTATTIHRAGRGKLRGRARKTPIGPLLVVSNACALERTIQGIPGVSIARVDSLNAEILAPGTHPGRLTLFTAAAMERLTTEGLYTEHPTHANASPKQAVSEKMPKTVQKQATPRQKNENSSPKKPSPKPVPKKSKATDQ